MLDLFIKACLLFLLGLVIYKQVFAGEEWQMLVDRLLRPSVTHNWWFLVFTILLIPVNWGLETRKWLSLLPANFGLGFWQSLRAVLVGVAISIITPNRIGEYGGRILLVKGRKRWDAVLATLVGSMAQLLVLLSGGIFGLLVYGGRHLDFPASQYNAALVIVGLLVIAGLYIFFNIARFERYLKPLTRRFKWVKHLLRIRVYSRKKLLSGLAWAALRYLTYVVQYLLILRFFGVEPPVLQGLAAIATIYLIQTSVPLPPLIAIFARGEIAILIWSVFSSDAGSILAASLSLFILNLSVPALLGSAILVQINVLKSLGYDNSE